MKRSGYPPDGYKWDEEFYQVTLQDLGDLTFRQAEFRPKAALVPRSPRADGLWEIEFNGEPFDEGEFDLIPDRWNHQNCKSCLFRIAPGHSYWQNETDNILCDECHAYVTRSRGARGT